MESPGEYLKRERELRRVSIAKIFEATRVSMKYLEALESDNYDALPHPTFVKGFIRSYCKTLGLDENDAVLRYEIYLKERAPEKAEPQKMSLPSISSRRNHDDDDEALHVPEFVKKYGLYAVLGVIALVIAVFLYTKGDDDTIVEEISQEQQAETAPAATEEARQEQPLDGASPAVEGVSKPKTATLTADQATQQKDAIVTQPDAAPSQHTLSIKANEVTWIKVRIDNQEAFDVILRQGENIVWKAESTFSLLVGNAGGVDVTYDGAKLAPLGKSGESVALKLPRKASQQAAPAKLEEKKAQSAPVKVQENKAQSAPAKTEEKKAGPAQNGAPAQ